MTLGIFDSGLGGLSVWKEFGENQGVLYFADTARAPYGNLTKDKLFIYAKESLDHLIDLGATSIAIACHTLATTVAPLLKHSSPVPLFDIASHSLPLLTPFQRLGIIGTQATIASGFYQKRLAIKPVSTVACPLLVPMIEKGEIHLDLIEKSLAPLDRNIDALFLACTHFPLISETLHALLPGIPLIDPAPIFAKNLLSLTKEVPDEFYTTGDPLQFHRCASIFSKIKKIPSPILIKSLYLSLHS